MSVEYKLSGNQIERVKDGETTVVGLYDADNKALKVGEGHGNLQSRIVRELNDMGHEVASKNVASSATVEPIETENETETINSAETVIVEPAPLPLRMRGDKTEEIVQHYHDHNFDEFVRRYGVTDRKPGADGLYPASRKTHLTRKVVTGDKGSQYQD